MSYIESKHSLSFVLSLFVLEKYANICFSYYHERQPIRTTYCIFLETFKWNWTGNRKLVHQTLKA